MLEGDWGLGEEEGTYSFLLAACHCQGHSAVILHSGGGLGSNSSSWFQLMIFPITSFKASPGSLQYQLVGAPYSDKIFPSLVVLVAS